MYVKWLQRIAQVVVTMNVLPIIYILTDYTYSLCHMWLHGSWKNGASILTLLVVSVAVVVAFFVCWAPFHAQRLMTLYIPAAKWTDNLIHIHKVIYYISGVCYFTSCTINPVLYSIMSLKFRQAFKQTVLKPKCCKRRVHSSKKRTYFSYRFSHKNGYSETSFTSVDPASPGGSHSHSNSDHSSEKRRSKPHNDPLNAVSAKTPAIVTDHEIPNGDTSDNANFIEGTDMKMHCLLTHTGGKNHDTGVHVHTPNSDKVQILVQLTTLK